MLPLDFGHVLRYSLFREEAGELTHRLRIGLDSLRPRYGPQVTNTGDE